MVHSFIHACRGLRDALRHEHNFRLQWLLGLMVLLLNSLVTLESWQHAMLLLLVFLVLALELHNCAIEKACDSSGLDFLIHKKHAKDYAAASVLFLSIGAAIIFLSIIMPHLPSIVEQARLSPNAYLTLSAVFLFTLPGILMKRPKAAKLLLVIGGGLDASFIFVSQGALFFLVLGGLFHIILLAALLPEAHCGHNA
jgi:diacylglycerol kinase